MVAAADPDALLHGRLRFSRDDGGTLDLAGELSSGGGTSGRYPVVLGVACGADYTLVDCFRTRRELNWGGSARYETVAVNQVLRGALLDDPGDLRGNAVSVAMRHLAEWVTDSGIEEQHTGAADPVPSDEPVFRLSTYRTPDQQAEAADGRTVVLSRHLGLEGDGVASRTLTQAFGLRVDAVDPTGRLPLDDLLDWASDLQDLVSVATGRTATLERVAYYDPASIAVVRLGEGGVEVGHRQQHQRSVADGGLDGGVVGLTADDRCAPALGQQVGGGAGEQVLGGDGVTRVERGDSAVGSWGRSSGALAGAASGMGGSGGWGCGMVIRCCPEDLRYVVD